MRHLFIIIDLINDTTYQHKMISLALNREFNFILYCMYWMPMSGQYLFWGSSLKKQMEESATATAGLRSKGLNIQ